MRPLPGMVPIAEFPSRWDAQLAVARLRQAGLEAALIGDPAAEVAPHHVTHRVTIVVVRAEVADEASEMLGVEGHDEWAEHLDSIYHQRRFADRPQWVRWATWILLVAVPGPFVVAGLVLGWRIARSLFP